MFMDQVSVFIENRKGRLDDVLETLKREDINIQSLSLADTSEYGVLRLIVSDPQKAQDALKASGFSAMLTKVLAITLTHRAGMLQKIIGILGKENINIEYMYSISSGTEDMPLVLKTSDIERTLEIVREQGAEIYTG